MGLSIHIDHESLSIECGVVVLSCCFVSFSPWQALTLKEIIAAKPKVAIIFVILRLMNCSDSELINTFY